MIGLLFVDRLDQVAEVLLVDDIVNNRRSGQRDEADVDARLAHRVLVDRGHQSSGARR
jgi:hypothetical protein